MKKQEKIIIGTTSVQKIDALKKAIEMLGMNIEVSGMKTSSGVNEQPFGFEETYTGALNRAMDVHYKNPNTLAMGIESGIFQFCKRTLDIAIIVLIDLNGKIIVTNSTGIEFPNEYVTEAQKSGFDTTTVGSIISERLGGDQTDPHSTLTNGKITRTDTLVQAIKSALQQI